MKRALLGVAIGLLALAAAAPAEAQPPGPHPSQNAFQFRLGGFFPSGGGELWDANEELFTLDHGDFNDAVLGFSYVTGITNNLELGFNIDFYESEAGSMDREIGLDPPPGLYPPHDTRLELMPVTLDFRFLPGGRYAYRGRQGQYVVHHPVPYLGAGIGLNFWEYAEAGYFIFEDLETGFYDAMYDEYWDDGMEFEAHVLAGIEIPMGPTWGLLFEARYSWSEGSVGRSYAGESALSSLNLSMDGLYVTLGASWHF